MCVGKKRKTALTWLSVLSRGGLIFGFPFPRLNPLLFHRQWSGNLNVYVYVREREREMKSSEMHQVSINSSDSRMTVPSC